MSPDAQSALSALRTWRTVTEDRDRLVRAAKSAGATWDQIIEASGLARGTVAGILSPKAAGGTGTVGAGPRTRVEHHPHFGGYDPSGSPAEAYMFRPFSGLEEPPLAPDRLVGESDAAYAQRIDRDEWRAAWRRWREAYLRLKARGPLTAMAARWADCTRTHAALTAAFDELVTGPDGQWRAGVNRLVEARRSALTAAASWDEAAADLLQLRARDPGLRELSDRAESLYGPVGSADGPYGDWGRAARDLGIDTSGWVVGDGHPCLDRVEGVIAVQDKRIDEINRLTER